MSISKLLENTKIPLFYSVSPLGAAQHVVEVGGARGDEGAATPSQISPRVTLLYLISFCLITYFILFFINVVLISFGRGRVELCEWGNTPLVCTYICSIILHASFIRVLLLNQRLNFWISTDISLYWLKYVKNRFN